MRAILYPENGTSQYRLRDVLGAILPFMGEDKTNQSVSKKAQEIVAENLEALIAIAPSGKQATGTFAKYVGVGNGTIDRLRKQDAKARISTLERISARFGLEVWHMLVPGLDPLNPPRLLSRAEVERNARLEQVIGELRPPPLALPTTIPKRVAHRSRKRVTK